MKSRVCNKCKTEKPLDKSNFHLDGSKNNGFAYICSPCWKIHKRPLEKERYMQKHYGIGMDGYLSMLKEQNECCYICKKTAILDIDHDHTKTTNQVRKLLCRDCNRGLGSFKDDPELLLTAIHYINYHKGYYV